MAIQVEVVVEGATHQPGKHQGERHHCGPWIGIMIPKPLLGFGNGELFDSCYLSHCAGRAFKSIQLCQLLVVNLRGLSQSICDRKRSEPLLLLHRSIRQINRVQHAPQLFITESTMSRIHITQHPSRSRAPNGLSQNGYGRQAGRQAGRLTCQPVQTLHNPVYACD